MTQLLFRNRWFALLWAVAICFSISRFFGDGGGQEQLAKAAADIRTKRVEAARLHSAEQQDFEESQETSGPIVADELPENADVSESQASDSEAY
jgi:hypothetical protein